MILTVAVSGYRSLRDIIIPLDQLTIITGANGTGKSNIYRSLRLLADVAQGRAISALAQDGGLQSTLWAGPEKITRGMRTGEHRIEGTGRSGPVSLKLGFADENFGYAIDLGLPIPAQTKFGRDPEIKAEALWIGETLRRSNTIASRNGPAVQVMQEDGNRKTVMSDLSSFDTMLTHAADTDNGFELLGLRERMRLWRFYDHLRTDQHAPARRAQIGTRTMALAADGSDLAAAVQTILEIGDREGFKDAISDAFPGSSVYVDENDGRFEILMQQHGMLRPLRTSELSDGTLRYLLLVAALFTPRPPPLLVLNEPETSLHSSLMAPLTRLIDYRAKTSQIILVSHDSILIDGLRGSINTVFHSLAKELGETHIENLDPPPWTWPSR